MSFAQLFCAFKKELNRHSKKACNFTNNKFRYMKVARIFYNWWGSGNFNNRSWALLDLDGDVEDYNTRSSCIKQAINNGWKYQVERWHKKERGKMTIMEKNF